MPRNSIIIPAYNAGRYLAETIESVRCQSVDDWELFVVDDGSSDDTASVAKTFHDHRIVYVHQSNQGVSSARNNGYELSQGEYISFLDADDTWCKDRLEKMNQVLDQSAEVGLVHADMQVIDENSHTTGRTICGRQGDILDSLLLWEGCNIPAPSSMMLRRSVVEEVGAFNLALSTAADQEFFFRVAKQCSVGRIPEVLGSYRIHTQNMHSDIQLVETDHLLAYNLAKKNGLFRSWLFHRQCLSKLYSILAGCWWHDGNNKPRAVYWQLRSLVKWPPSIAATLNRILKTCRSDKK